MNINFAAFSCLHAPFGDPNSVQWLLDTLANLNPRPRLLINLGDLFNSDVASVHPNTADHQLEDEYRQASRFLDDVRGVVPHRCKYVWLLGNHDDNLLVEDERRIDKRIHSLLHWNRSPFSKEFKRWEQLPYEKSKIGVYELGQVFFTHGYDCGINSDELETLQFVHILGGLSHRLGVRGHTHSPVGITRALRTRTTPLDHWFCNVGTLGSLKPAYMKRKASFRWGPALCVGEADPNPDYNKGKQWDAHLITPEGIL